VEEIKTFFFYLNFEILFDFFSLIKVRKHTKTKKKLAQTTTNPIVENKTFDLKEK